MCWEIQEVFYEALLEVEWNYWWRFRKWFGCWCDLWTCKATMDSCKMCISALVSPVIQRNLLLWKLLKGEGFPTVWQHCQLISLDNILPITTIHKSVLFFIPRWSCNVPSNVGTTSCDLWESLGRGAYSQAYAGLLCDTRASQHHVWGFSPKLEILPNRETGWVEHSWNFFYFLIKRNKSHWNFLNINLSCQRIYLNIEWNQKNLRHW